MRIYISFYIASFAKFSLGACFFLLIYSNINYSPASIVPIKKKQTKIALKTAEAVHARSELQNTFTGCEKDP